MRLLRVSVAGLLLLAVASPAVGDVTTARDEREWKGDFNIWGVRHDHGQARPGAAPRLQHKVTMYREWRSYKLKRRGDIGLFFPKLDRHIDLDYRDGLRARMYDGNEPVGRPNVWRSSERSVTVAFPRRWLGKGVESYRWYAHSSWYPPCRDTRIERASSSCVGFVDQSPTVRSLTAE